MRSSFSYAVAGLFCWATLTPVLAQKKPNVAPNPSTDPPSETKITSNTKINGKTLKEWVADIKADPGRSADPSVQRTAIQAVINYGPVARNDAVPAIISVLNNRDRVPEVSIKVNGAMALGLIGIDEKDLKNGVPCLINMLGDRQAIVRQYAVGALARLGQDARSAIPHLVNLTKSQEDSETRQGAVDALGIMAWDTRKKEGPDAIAFRAIAEALSDHSIQVRYDAVKALIMIGPSKVNADRNIAIGKLEVLRKHPDKVEVVWAHLALMRMDNFQTPQSTESNLKAMAKLLKYPESRVRSNAAQALSAAWALAKKYPNPPNQATITPKSGWGVAISDLIERLSEKDLDVVGFSILALGEIGPAAMKAKPQLELLAQHKNQSVQEAAKAALEKITGRERANLGEPTRQ